MKLLKLLVLLPLFAQAQDVDYNKIVLPGTIVSQVFEERLIQLAWVNHPSSKSTLQMVELTEKEKKLAKITWLNDLYAAGNLNEITIKRDRTNELVNVNNQFPRYNFGVRFSLGTFFSVPLNTKIANDKNVMAKNAVDERKLELREVILTNVERLKLYYKFIKLREQIKEDYLTMYKDAERNFSVGEVTIEGYRNATQAYYKQVESVVEAQSTFQSVKLALESFIGLELENVNGYQEFIKKLDEELKYY